jgi:hypothetical protein
VGDCHSSMSRLFLQFVRFEGRKKMGGRHGLLRLGLRLRIEIGDSCLMFIMSERLLKNCMKCDFRSREMPLREN